MGVSVKRRYVILAKRGMYERLYGHPQTGRAFDDELSADCHAVILQQHLANTLGLYPHGIVVTVVPLFVGSVSDVSDDWSDK